MSAGAASLLFTLGIVGTGPLAVPVLAGWTAYAITEAVGRPEGLGKSFRGAKLFYGVIISSMILGLGMDFVGIGAVRALCQRGVRAVDGALALHITGRSGLRTDGRPAIRVLGREMRTIAPL